MKVVQISIGRSHHFHLARELERHAVLERIFTAYPKWRLRNEDGVPSAKIDSFPWVHAPFMARSKLGFTQGWISREWAWWARQSLDAHASGRLGEADTLVAMAGCGLRSGLLMKARGGRFVCDRGSAHIRFQDRLLREEHARWGLKYAGIEPRGLAKEEAEYEAADVITVPSQFARKSYVAEGIAPEKLREIPYGVRKDRFRPLHLDRTSEFFVLYVGGVTVRKGFLYLLEAFRKLPAIRKKLIVVGVVDEVLRPLLAKQSREDVVFLSHMPNEELVKLYNQASVCVLPSVEDGFGMTILEALACGCPVIASQNTGGAERIVDGISGWTVPACDARALEDALGRVADDPDLGEKTLASAHRINDWRQYGESMFSTLEELHGSLVEKI